MVAITERPAIYQKTELPTFLNRGLGGLLLVNENFVKEGGIGPYDWVMDFGHSRDGLRETVPPEQRITKNTRKDLFFLGFDNPRITGRMGEITKLANDPKRSPEIKADRLEYRMHLKFVYQTLARAVPERIGWEKPLLLPPKNGGIFVAEVYQECGFPSGFFFDYRMSRILGTDGRLMVGMKLGENNPQIADFRNFVVADDCLASDISAWGTLEMIKDQLGRAQVPSSEARIIIAVSAGTQRGLESLLSVEARRHFGFGKMEAVVGIPVYKMTTGYYLEDADSEGRLVVGDMGRWTRP